MKSIKELKDKTTAADPETGHIQHGTYTVTDLIGSVMPQGNMEIALVNATQVTHRGTEPFVLLTVSNNRTNTEIAIPKKAFDFLIKRYKTTNKK
jgi:hypothetical protein